MGYFVAEYAATPLLGDVTLSFNPAEGMTLAMMAAGRGALRVITHALLPRQPDLTSRSTPRVGHPAWTAAEIALAGGFMECAVVLGIRRSLPLHGSLEDFAAKLTLERVVWVKGCLPEARRGSADA